MVRFFILLFCCLQFSNTAAKISTGNTWVDSMQIDTQRKHLKSKFELKLPVKKVNRKVDKFSPFKNQLYAQQSLNKFWFFAMFLISSAALVVFMQNFSSQFYLRIVSNFNGLKYRELKSEKLSRLQNGNFYLFFLNAFAHSLFFVVLIIRLRYFELNNSSFFLLFFILYLVMQMGVYLLKYAQTNILQIPQVLTVFTHKQINIELVFSLFYIPVSLVLYLNPQLLFAIHPVTIAALLVLPLALRVFLQLWAIIQEQYISFIVLLYFCTFEILPLVVIVYTIVKILHANR